MIIYFMEAQNLVAEHYEREIGMIFYFMAAQNFVEEHYILYIWKRF